MFATSTADNTYTLQLTCWHSPQARTGSRCLACQETTAKEGRRWMRTEWTRRKEREREREKGEKGREEKEEDSKAKSKVCLSIQGYSLRSRQLIKIYVTVCTTKQKCINKLIKTIASQRKAITNKKNTLFQTYFVAKWVPVASLIPFENTFKEQH